MYHYRLSYTSENKGVANFNYFINCNIKVVLYVQSSINDYNPMI